MALTEKEAKQLAELQKKEKEKPAADRPSGKVLNISIDLGDPDQVEKAQKLGLLDLFEDGEGDGGEGDGSEGDGGEGDGGEGDDPPIRKGFFGSDA